jgi:hypothetical protein
MLLSFKAASNIRGHLLKNDWDIQILQTISKIVVYILTTPFGAVLILSIMQLLIC